MGSKGGDAPDTQTVKNEPWSGVQGPLRNLYGTTQRGLANVQPYYPGQTFPNLTPLQEAGMFGNLDYAQNFYGPATTGYQQQLGRYMDAPLNITQDPAVQNMMAANAAQTQDWLTERALPLVRQGAQASNMFGSSKQDIAEGQAIGDAAQALANANAQTALGAYDTASGLARQGATLFPGALQMGFMPGDLAQQYGGAYQGLAGQQVAENMNRYFFPEDNLWSRMGTAGNIYSGAGNYGTQTSTMPGTSGSPIAGAIGGGLLGSQIPGAIIGTGLESTLFGMGLPGGVAGLSAWPFALGGALLGGLLS